MKLSELLAYHGTDKAHETQLKAPLFLTTDRSGARWYAVNRGGAGVIIKGEIEGAKLLNLMNDYDDKFLEMAKKAGIKFSMKPYFYCAEIKKHSPNDGGNPNDLVYVPKMQAALKAAGYDGIHTSDVLENEEIETIILLDTSKFKTKGHEEVSVDDED